MSRLNASVFLISSTGKIVRARTTNSSVPSGCAQNTGTERDLVKVATYNINNINKRLDNLLDWLAKAEPDVVSLQELKAEQGAFPVNALRTLGYEAVWQGERSWNGVAILARNHVPVLTRTSLPGNPEGHFSETRNLEDHQARYIEAAGVTARPGTEPFAQKHLFVGSENSTALVMRFQLFAVASGDGFLGN